MIRESQIPAHARRTRTAVHYRDRFIRTFYVGGHDITLEDVQENVAVGREIMNGDALPLMVDIRMVRSFSADARAYLASPNGIKLAPAVAVVVSSPLSRTIVNFYLGFNRPKVPTRIFNDYVSADIWLENYTERQAEVA